jgi:hypothetical protein
MSTYYVSKCNYLIIHIVKLGPLRERENFIFSGTTDESSIPGKETSELGIAEEGNNKTDKHNWLEPRNGQSKALNPTLLCVLDRRPKERNSMEAVAQRTIHWPVTMDASTKKRFQFLENVSIILGHSRKTRPRNL